MIHFETINLLRRLADKLYQKREIKDAYSLAAAIVDIVRVTGISNFYADTPMGACPLCGNNEGLLRIGHKQYGLCHAHRVYWYLGTDYLAILDQGDESLCQAQEILDTYTQLSTADAFPAAVCACCGLFITHTPWCVIPSLQLDAPLF